ncbi:hypothetical protein B0H13DRAFT_1853413 [Mycena leptocephala]|nr:hypothetical protein B0H13DRAFT_1853413 [Mycena leptocephala]
MAQIELLDSEIHQCNSKQNCLFRFPVAALVIKPRALKLFILKEGGAVTGPNQLHRPFLGQITCREKNSWDIRWATKESNRAAEGKDYVRIHSHYFITKIKRQAKPGEPRPRERLRRQHHSNRYYNVKEAWRKPKGIDNRTVSGHPKP